MTSLDLLSAAPFYLGLGWPMFVLSATKMPVRNCAGCADTHLTPGEKEGCTCLLCHGFYAATLDPARFAEMVRLHPTGLLAVRTGRLSGLVVVDVDPRHGGLDSLHRLETNRGRPLPRDAVQVTGGGGFHLLYAHPGRRVGGAANKLGAGIDVKGDGGYIVVSPSRHPVTGDAYMWLTNPAATPPPPLPRDLEATLCPVPTRLVPPMAPARWTSPGATGKRWAAILSTLDGAADGERNTLLHWAARKAREMISAGTLTESEAGDALEASGRRLGLTASEIQGTIRSGAGVRVR